MHSFIKFRIAFCCFECKKLHISYSLRWCVWFICVHLRAHLFHNAPQTCTQHSFLPFFHSSLFQCLPSKTYRIGALLCVEFRRGSIHLSDVLEQKKLFGGTFARFKPQATHTFIRFVRSNRFYEWVFFRLYARLLKPWFYRRCLCLRWVACVVLLEWASARLCEWTIKIITVYRSKGCNLNWVNLLSAINVAHQIKCTASCVAVVVVFCFI